MPCQGYDEMAIPSKTVLITGGAGFLGSHVCERLLDSGCHVVCVDNLVTGSRSNLEHLGINSRFRFIEHDLVRPLDLSGVHDIYNFACPASPRQYQMNPVHTLKTCVYGADNMLELARSQNARMLQVSTSEVYGDPHIHPQPESYAGHVNPIGTRACYEEGKRAAEALCFDYRRQYGVRIKIVRLFNVYGPRMQLDDGRVIPNFILQALQNQPVTIYGDGEQTRSFCYVTDIVDGIAALMTTDDAFTGPLNIGNPDEISMLALAEMIIRLTGSASRIIHRPKSLDDPRRRRPDIELAARSLEWRPVTPLQAGLLKTIAYFDSLLGKMNINERKSLSFLETK